MIRYSTVHSHTDYCDGKNKAEEMVLSAIDKGMKTIGISTHGPLPFESNWSISKDKIESYINEVRDLKKKYSDKIEVLLGMELDYFADTEFEHIDKSLFEKLDYFVGSTHYLGRFEDGKPWCIDSTYEDLLKGINSSYGGDVKKAVIDYYHHQSRMVEKYEPTVLGHMDLIKKNNKNNVLFNEDESWYQKAICNFLDVVKNTNTVIEINTGGIARGYMSEQYPSKWILEEIKLRGIPVAINSDSHAVETIDFYYDEMYELCKSIGLDNLVYLTNKGWQKITL